MNGSTATSIIHSATDRADMPLENSDDDSAASLEERIQRVIEEDRALFDALDE